MVVAHKDRRRLGRLARLERELALILHVGVAVQADRDAGVEPVGDRVRLIELAELIPEETSKGTKMSGFAMRGFAQLIEPLIT